MCPVQDSARIIVIESVDLKRIGAMRRRILRWTMVLAVTLLGVVPLAAQEVEITVRQVATMGYCPELASVGVRLNKEIALGLGAGYNNFRNSYSIPFHLYKRTYFPIGTKERFSFYSDVILGYEYNYKVYGLDYDTGSTTVRRGTDTFWLSWQPGISLRLFGKSNLFLGPSVYLSLKEFVFPSIGLHLGLAL